MSYIKGDPIKDTKTDMWALGITLYQLVTGYLPFTGETPYDVLMKIANAKPGSTWLRVDNKILEQLIAGLLREDPDSRFSAEDVINLIDESEMPNPNKIKTLTANVTTPVIKNKSQIANLLLNFI